MAILNLVRLGVREVATVALVPDARVVCCFICSALAGLSLCGGGGRVRGGDGLLLFMLNYVDGDTSIRRWGQRGSWAEFGRERGGRRHNGSKTLFNILERIPDP